MGKGEIARDEQFLLFPQCFQKACFPGVSKGVIVWEWVNCCISRQVIPQEVLKTGGCGKKYTEQKRIHYTFAFGQNGRKMFLYSNFFFVKSNVQCLVTTCAVHVF